MPSSFTATLATRRTPWLLTTSRWNSAPGTTIRIWATPTAPIVTKVDGGIRTVSTSTSTASTRWDWRGTTVWRTSGSPSPKSRWRCETSAFSIYQHRRRRVALTRHRQFIECKQETRSKKIPIRQVLRYRARRVGSKGLVQVVPPFVHFHATPSPLAPWRIQMGKKCIHIIVTTCHILFLFFHVSVLIWLFQLFKSSPDAINKLAHKIRTVAHWSDLFQVYRICKCKPSLHERRIFFYVGGEGWFRFGFCQYVHTRISLAQHKISRLKIGHPDVRSGTFVSVNGNSIVRSFCLFFFKCFSFRLGFFFFFGVHNTYHII